jgi:uncharacterized protein (DUF1810 family)
MKNDLTRFIEAQERDYQIALSEIKSGRKRSHWMWYIFPQIAGLGYSETSKFYAIKDIEEAKDYLDNEILGNRLVEISAELLHLNNNNAATIFGVPDDMKLQSSMTLFSQIEESSLIFKMVLDKFFDGKLDDKTMQRIRRH